MRLSRFKLERQHPQPGHRAEDHRGRHRPGHLLPRRRQDRLRRRRATSTCPPATTPTRSPPTASRRWTSGPNRNPAFDAQRTAGNTNDLRGKLLRIKVRANGSYTIPAGNLFKVGTAKTRPEIYAMGLRNPFRFAVDKTTGVVYVGDYSPDANAPNPARGPAGQGRWMAIDKPANYGWPYCASPDLPYVDFDFATNTSGAPFNCAAPVNESPHNTGKRNLPKVEKPEVIYSYGASAEFPELGTGGIGPMGGPAYDFDRTQQVGDQVAGRVRRAAAVLRVDPRLRQGVPPGPPATRSPRSTRCCRRSSSTTRWTWSSARTARSTSWSTATATSPRTRTRNSPGSTSCAATAPRSRRSPPPRRAARPRSR